MSTCRFNIRSELRSIRQAAEIFRSFLEENGCTPSEVQACELALVESCNNAVLYSGRDRAQDVTVEGACSADQIELRITDHTPGFEWPGKARLPAAESETGRGVFLIQAVMDSSQYQRGSKANTLVLRKNRRSSPRP